jgi:protein-S-isoprenylcysteine O-methyltransferase Ste14
MIVDLPMFTLIHVVISVLGIITGLVVVGGLMAGARLDTWTALFLGTTILTSFTGFFFPFTGITPPYVVGAISLAVLALCLAARYWKRSGGGRRTSSRPSRRSISTSSCWSCSSSPRHLPSRSWRPRSRRPPLR